MSTKTISITEEAYERLKSKKSENESFTDVINKITGKRSLLELAGFLSEEEADRLEKHIKEGRKASRKRF
jgi:predicted CopG family antitoxin